MVIPCLLFRSKFLSGQRTSTATEQCREIRRTGMLLAIESLLLCAKPNGTFIQIVTQHVKMTQNSGRQGRWISEKQDAIRSFIRLVAKLKVIKRFK